MRKNTWLVIVGVALIIVLALAAVFYDQLADKFAPENGLEAETTAAPEAERIEAPDFTVYDREGNAVKLSDFEGKPVVLNFWASWCGPCKSEMPAFEEAYATYGDQVHFVMVNLTDGWQETQEKAENLLEEQGYTFPVYFDKDQDAARVYGVTGIPTTYFIDAEGYAVAAAQSALRREHLETGIGMILE